MSAAVVVLLAKVKAAGGSVSLSDDKVIARKIPKALLPELQAHKAEIMAFLMESAKDTSTEMITCHTCVHRTAMRSCGDPVRAGLADYFAIRWHPSDGYGCPAWAPKKPPPDEEIIWICGESYIAVTVCCASAAIPINR